MPNANSATESMLRAEDKAARERDQSQPMKPFAIRNLSVLAYANGFTLWHQKVDNFNDLLSSNYFSEAADMMAVGDHIHVSALDGSALLAVECVEPNKVIVRKMFA